MSVHADVVSISLAERAESIAGDARQVVSILARLPATAMDDGDRVEIALMRASLATILAEMCAIAALSESALDRVGAMTQARFMLETARRDVGRIQASALRALSSLRVRHPA